VHFQEKEERKRKIKELVGSIMSKRTSTRILKKVIFLYAEILNGGSA